MVNDRPLLWRTTGLSTAKVDEVGSRPALGGTPGGERATERVSMNHRGRLSRRNGPKGDNTGCDAVIACGCVVLRLAIATERVAIDHREALCRRNGPKRDNTGCDGAIGAGCVVQGLKTATERVAINHREALCRRGVARGAGDGCSTVAGMRGVGVRSPSGLGSCRRRLGSCLRRSGGACRCLRTTRHGGGLAMFAGTSLQRPVRPGGGTLCGGPARPASRRSATSGQGRDPSKGSRPPSVSCAAPRRLAHPRSPCEAHLSRALRME